MKKRTLICIHVMPAEIEMFERLMHQMKRALTYLDDTDDVTLKVTLNLNPELTDWENSELKNGHFISRFGILFNGIKIGYAYGLNLSKLIKTNGGSHEVMIGYCFNLGFGGTPQKYRSVRFL